MTDSDYPNPLDLLRSGVKIGTITDVDREDGERLRVIERRLDAVAAQTGAPAIQRVTVDLSPFARMAGVSVEKALELADVVPPCKAVNRDTPSAIALSGSRVPPIIAAKILSGVVTDTKPVRDVREWLAGTGWALILGGAKGTGKTVGAIVGLVEAGGGLFVTARELADRESGGEMVKMCRAARFLVLDDMGNEGGWDDAAERVEGVLDACYKRGVRVIGTTNLNRRGVGQWAERYGARIDDRLNEGGRFIGYDGASLRGAR